MQRILAFLILLFSVCSASSQMARLQIIHNSPDTSIQFVDIYINGALVIDSLEFRTATAFFDVSANVDVEIKVAIASTDNIASAFYIEVTYFLLNTPYVAVLNGEIASADFNPFMPFGIDVYENALEIGTNASGTDIMVCQGSPDLGTIDVTESELIQLTAFEDLPYGGFSGYLGLFTANYVLTISDFTGSPVYGSFSAPFADYGWGGDAITIVCSGFVNQAANFNGDAFGLWVATATGGPLIELPVMELNLTARVQLIHNCADQIATEFDIYLNGSLVSDNFAFRTSTPFWDVPAVQEIELAFANATSNSVDEAISTYTMNLTSGETYIMIANGILSSTGYDPLSPFSLDVLVGARETAILPSDVMINVFNGATDGPVIDIHETTVWNDQLVDGLVYSDFSGYFSIPNDDYIFAVSDNSSANQIGEYLASFESYNLAGSAVTVLTSGFLNTSLNSNGPEYGLWVSSPLGGSLIPLELVPEEPVFANAQFIHNCADSEAAVVDVYVNGEIFIDDFLFHHATPFMSIQVNSEVVVDIAGDDSQNVSDAFAQIVLDLEAEESHVIIISGIVSASGYNPAPSLDLHVYNQARQSALIPTDTDVLFYQGSTDTPPLDIAELNTPLPEVAVNLGYSEFTDYLSLNATSNYALEVTDAAGNVMLGQFTLPVNSMGLIGQSLVVFTGGFNTPENNSDGIAFSLWMTESDGTTTELPVYVGLKESTLITDLNIFPNPTDGVFGITGKTIGQIPVELTLLDAQQRVVWNSPLLNVGSRLSYTADFSSLEAGLYLLRISDGHFANVQPVLIVK